MSFSPETDLNVLQALFIGDTSLREMLDLEDADIQAVAQKMVAEHRANNLATAYVKIRESRIIKRSIWTDLAGTEKRLCCYFRPSRQAGISIVTNEVLQVDCHVPAAQDYMAYRTIARVEKLLYNQQIGNRIYEFEGQLGELPSASGFICVGARFTFYAIK